MAKWTYDQAMRRVFADEGGYCDDTAKGDSGGPTKYGVTIRDVRLYLNPGATASDVKALSVEDAMHIYRNHYATPIKYDELPAGVDYAILDYAINSGVGRAGKVLRKLVGWPTNSSAITSEVLAAVSKRDPVKLITAIYDERLTFLRSLRIFPTFGKGWTRRCVGGEAAAVAMARQRGPSSLPPEVIPSGGKGKGQIPTPNTTPITHGGPVVAVGVGTGLWGWFSSHPVLSVLIVAGLLAGILVALNAIRAAHAKKQETPPADLKPVPERSSS